MPKSQAARTHRSVLDQINLAINEATVTNGSRPHTLYIPNDMLLKAVQELQPELLGAKNIQEEANKLTSIYDLTIIRDNTFRVEGTRYKMH